MTLTDYKFNNMSRRNNGTMVVRIRFHEGAHNPGLDFEGEVIGYERSGFVKRPVEDFASMVGVKVDLVEGGNAVLLNFTTHQTDLELLKMLDVVLAEDTTRTPIDARKVRA